jgi:hypothetical protein
MAVVAVLVSLLVVAVAAATRTSQGASTRQLMASIKQGLARFKADVGYLPPVLGHRDPDEAGPANNHDLRKLFDPRGAGSPPIWGFGQPIDDCYPDQPTSGGFQKNSAYADNIQEWYSYTSPAEYLVGYGHHDQDGHGFVPAGQGGPAWEGEKPALGIRHPDVDGVWGATVYAGDGTADGSLLDRMYPPYGSALSMSKGTGPVFGPYIDLKDERLLGASDGTVDSSGRLVVSFPGEGNYRDDLPKVLCDYWGNPIRYYRRLYAPGSLASEYRPSPTTAGGAVPPPTLADVFALRPFKLSPGAAIDGIPDAAGDTTTSTALRGAEFALFSPGADRLFNQFIRYDDPGATGNDQGPGGSPTNYANEDNLVEVAP